MIFWKLRLCRSCHPRGRGWNCRFLGIEFLKICLIGRNVYVFINQKKGLNHSTLLYTVYNEEFLIEKSGGGNVRIYTKDKKTVKNIRKICFLRANCSFLWERFDLFDHFHRSTRAIRSRAIFYKDRKGHKIEDRNIERSISQPWLQMKQSNLCSVHNRFYKEKNRECLVHFTYTVCTG